MPTWTKLFGHKQPRFDAASLALDSDREILFSKEAPRFSIQIHRPASNTPHPDIRTMMVTVDNLATRDCQMDYL